MTTKRLAIASLLALAMTATACGTTPEPRQADRAVDESLPIPTFPPSGALFVVEQGTVTEEFAMSGIADATDRTPLTTPYNGSIVTMPPARGTPVVEGDILFEFEPGVAVLAAAAEFEAAQYALRYGSGPRDEREARLEAATALATELGIQVDDPSVLPIPRLITITATEPSTVLARYGTRGEPVRQGTIVVELGDTDDIFVQAEVTDSVANVIGIGESVTVTHDTDSDEPLPTSGTLESIDVNEDDSQSVTIAVRETDVQTGDRVVIQRDSRSDAPAMGTVVATSPDDDAPTHLIVDLDQPFFVLDESVEVALRSDIDERVPGTISGIETLANGSPIMNVLVPPDAFEFGDRVRVTISGRSSQNVNWLPPEAIRSYEGTAYVIVDEVDGRRRVEVEFGIRTETQVELIGDIVAGEVVIGP